MWDAVVDGAASKAARELWSGVDTVGKGAAPAAGGGGFEMTPEELTALIGLWEDELEKISQDTMTIEGIIAGLVPPGTDPVSAGYVDTGIESLFALQTQNDSMRIYATEYVAKLKMAKQKTETKDADTADALNQAAGA
ncbi:hypothetical protein [Amycolatopsis suaedae]|uniref:PE domain-containing protein n=1 Tax=Amycolatopsis suaedae TaxID=2510978 RepID=A0A4Q7J930_9PSEU|nr:hypothetical protein [Amycolatopsis suaedae]RZQ63727.1 hypothetical protein EWH70_11180 [Amycolatopsis suaedae]